MRNKDDARCQQFGFPDAAWLSSAHRRSENTRGPLSHTSARHHHRRAHQRALAFDQASCSSRMRELLCRTQPAFNQLIGLPRVIRQHLFAYLLHGR